MRKVNSRQERVSFYTSVTAFLLMLAVIGNIFKLAMGVGFDFGVPDLWVISLDSPLGFAVGVLLIILTMKIVLGSLRLTIRAAVAGMFLMPLVYLSLVMSSTHPDLSFVKMLPALLIILYYGNEITRRYRLKYRRLT